MKLLIDAGNTRIKWALVDGTTRRAQASGETTSHSTRPSKDAVQVDGYDAGMPSPRLLPQSAGFAITSDSASVAGSPSRMASGFSSNVSEADGDGWLRNGVLPVGQAGELPGIFPNSQKPGSQEIEQIWASNVAGEEVARHIRNIKAGRINFIVAKDMQCGVHNSYANAGQLGSDRWAALVAAWHLVRGKCMVVNCGTAITIDTLSGQGRFLGGLILPGMELMQRNLVAATNQLKLAQGKYAAFPLNTADALFSGAIQACCGAIERQYVLLEDDSTPVVLSGGAAGVLQAHLRHVTDKATSQSTRRASYTRRVAGYGEASRSREEVQGDHSRTGGLYPTVSWPHINLPLNVVDDLVLQGLLLISQETGA